MKTTRVASSRTLRWKSWRSSSSRAKSAFARARRSGGSATPLSSNPSIKLARSLASGEPGGACAAFTRLKTRSFWKISVHNAVYLRRHGSVASRTALSGESEPSTEIGLRVSSMATCSAFHSAKKPSPPAFSMVAIIARALARPSSQRAAMAGGSSNAINGRSAAGAETAIDAESTAASKTRIATPVPDWVPVCTGTTIACR